MSPTAATDDAVNVTPDDNVGVARTAAMCVWSLAKQTGMFAHGCCHWVGPQLKDELSMHVPALSRLGEVDEPLFR